MQLYNTLTRKKEAFEPLNPPKVGIYMCGMTVQDRPHLGHMRAFLAGDVLRRYLEYKGYDVSYIQNFTDIDDKIIHRARRENVDWRQIAERNITEYLRAAEAMNFKPATFFPRATLHIQEIIETVQTLMDQGIAYPAGDSIYFDISKFPSYGKLSGKKLEDLLAGYRVEPAPGKRNPADFALWKGWKEGEPYWHSPFGKGRPGWHIECSVMSTHYLGQPFDIHGGGSDLIFPHHENEIAQAEAAHGKAFARYWFHVGFVKQAGEKMSKSTGLFTPITDLLQRYSSQAIRHYLLSTHYRTPIDFEMEHLDRSERAMERITNFLRKAPDPKNPVEEMVKSPELQDWLQKFEQAMDDDLNTPGGLAVIFEMVRQGNEALQAQRGDDAAALKAGMIFLMNVLGFRLEEKERTDLWVDDLLGLIVEVRQILRQEKRFDLADLIRDRLKALGVVLEDTPSGTLWTIKGSPSS